VARLFPTVGATTGGFPNASKLMFIYRLDLILIVQQSKQSFLALELCLGSLNLGCVCVCVCVCGGIPRTNKNNKVEDPDHQMIASEDVIVIRDPC
jgi:hypothetical protein